MLIRRRATRPTERQRMRPWLEHLLNEGKTPGCSWVNRTEQIFSVEWKHGSRHGWSVEHDAQVFQKWAKHTGQMISNVDDQFMKPLNSIRFSDYITSNY